MHQSHPPNDQAQLLTGVLDSSLDGIYAFKSERDDQGQIVDFRFVVVNQAAEKLVGRTADQLLGERMLEMLPGNKTDGLFDAYVQVVETGTPFVTEHYYEHDGLATWFRISASKCGDGFTVSFSDITEQERSREQLALANERLELMVAGNASGIWDWDCQSGDLYWSPRFKELLGYKDNEIEPRYEDFESRLHPEDRQRTIDRLFRHINDQRPYDVEYRIRRKDGTYIWCHAAGQAQWDASGKPIRMAGSLADISNRKADQAELIDQQHRLEIALNATSTGLWDWDTQSGETYFSDSWYTMLGYEPGEMPMNVQSWMDITEPSDLEHAKAALDRYFKGKTDRYACEIRVRNKDGDWRWVLDVGEAIERDADGNVTRMIGLHVDIQEQKLTQFQLEQARDAAQQASAAKSAFVANMSHEIRTPMNAILGYADLLLDTDQTEADKRNHAQTIRRNGKHLLTILNDVLDISKIEAGKMSVEHIECSPDQVFADAIALMMPKAVERGVELDLEADGELPDCITTDPTRLQQILHNLVGNAIKFTESGSVRVVVRSQPLEHNQLRITCDVIDTGIGIYPDQLAKLFKPFEQADHSTTRRFGGSGLGLTISSNLCTLLGGKLTCVSTPGEGSTFSASVTVGVVTQAQAEPANERTSIDECEMLVGRRVLVVEDAVDNQRLVNHYLTKSGCLVEIAENGELGRDTALQALRRDEPFDIVLMDMQMPVLDGYNATRELRDAGYQLPIIALTAHASASDREACIEAGCTDYLSKPIARQDLVHMIAGHLDTKQHENAEA